MLVATSLGSAAADFPVPRVVVAERPPARGGSEDGVSDRGPVGEVAADVLEAAQRGDREAFAALVRHYDPRLRALAFHLLGDPHLTDDALQDAYVKAFRALDEFSGRSSLGTWLHRITYTTCLDHLRRRARLVPSGDLREVGEAAWSDDPSDDVAAADSVATALRELPEAQRVAIVLVAVAGMEYRQAAEVLDVPTGTVASRVASAKVVLRAAYDRERRDRGASTGSAQEASS
jgi:RNA polymerase sigma-70 factor (ECF subfamily)